MYRPLAVAATMLLAAILSGCMGGGGSKTAPGDAPEASFEFSPLSPAVGEAVQFTDASNGSVTEWYWDFGDGEFGTGPEATHAYANKGVYEVRLQVRDAQQRTDDYAQFIQVGGATDPGGLKVDFRYKIDGNVVDFEPVVTPAGSSVEQYFWDFGDGETSKQPAPLHTYAEIGEYVVELRIATTKGVASTAKKVAVGVISSDPSDFGARSFVVIAIVDSGINPYHEEFAAPEFQEHPARYVEGYPADAIEMPLSLDISDYRDAVKADEAVWNEVKSKQLYWIPGTRIIGAVSVQQRGAEKILDDGEDDGHGTATASDAAGASIGSCPECLIVMVEGLGQEPLEWALKQPWIDVVSNSWSSEICLAVCPPASTNLYPPVISGEPGTRSAVEAGKEVLFASGNGALNAFESPQMTYWNRYSGPDWVVTVGAAEAGSGSTVIGTGRPVDVVSYGIDWKGASHTSTETVRSFGGTSAATPIVAGAYGHVLFKVREEFLDTTEGPHARGVVATGEPAKGALSDGKVTRHEIERALFLTARGATSISSLIFPPVLPDSAARFAYAGYGIIDKKSAVDALAVVLGSKPTPARANDDAWASVDSEIRQGLWGSYDPGGDRLASPADASERRAALLQAVLG